MPLQDPRDRQKLRVMKVIYIFIEFNRPVTDALRGAKDPVPPALSAPYVHNLDSISLGVTKPIRHHQGNIMASACKAAALLVEDPDVVPRMCRSQMYDSHQE